MLLPNGRCQGLSRTNGNYYYCAFYKNKKELTPKEIVDYRIGCMRGFFPDPKGVLKNDLHH